MPAKSWYLTSIHEIQQPTGGSTATTSARTYRPLAQARDRTTRVPVPTSQPHRPPPRPPARPPNPPRRPPGAGSQPAYARVACAATAAAPGRPVPPSRQLTEPRARVHMMATGKLSATLQTHASRGARAACDRHQAHRVSRFARSLARIGFFSPRSVPSQRQQQQQQAAPRAGLGQWPGNERDAARDRGRGMMPACPPVPTGEGSSPDRPSAPRRRYEQIASQLNPGRPGARLNKSPRDLLRPICRPGREKL